MKFYEWTLPQNGIVTALADVVDGMDCDVYTGPKAHVEILKQLKRCGAAPAFIEFLEQVWCEHQQAPVRNNPTTMRASTGLSRRPTSLIDAGQDSQPVAGLFHLDKQEIQRLMEWIALGLWGRRLEYGI